MNEILDIVYEMAIDLVQAGAMDNATKCKIDAICLSNKRTIVRKNQRLDRKHSLSKLNVIMNQQSSSVLPE